MKTKRAYTFTEPGCYADGVRGHAGVREMLSTYVSMVATTDYAKRIALELKQDPSDDMSEEDDALAILDDATDPSLYWHFENGDLMLSPRV